MARGVSKRQSQFFYVCTKNAPTAPIILPARGFGWSLESKAHLPLVSAQMTSSSFTSLPGADLVQRGLEDLNGGRDSAEALLVSIGAPRLRSIGIEVPMPIASPEHKLYRLLSRERGDAAHSAYNALIRRLVSFERAAACGS